MKRKKRFQKKKKLKELKLPILFMVLLLIMSKAFARDGTRGSYRKQAGNNPYSLETLSARKSLMLFSVLTYSERWIRQDWLLPKTPIRLFLTNGFGNVITGNSTGRTKQK